MGKTIHLGYQIEPVWDVVKQIRTKVESVLGEFSEEVRYASKMTASELIENAVKYGGEVAQGTGISFEFTATEQQIEMTTRNAVTSQEDYDNVRQLIDLIHAQDPEELYLNRLHALIDTRKSGRSRLGLLRVAYEGQFTLSYRCQDDILTIAAIKKCPLSSQNEDGIGDFIHGELTVSVKHVEESMIMRWLGQSTSNDLGSALTPYLDRFIEDVRGRNVNVVIKFNHLEFLNTLSIREILQFLAKLNSNGVQTLVLYAAAVSWQRLSFRVLEKFCRKMTHITIQGE